MLMPLEIPISIPVLWYANVGITCQRNHNRDSKTDVKCAANTGHSSRSAVSDHGAFWGPLISLVLFQTTGTKEMSAISTTEINALYVQFDMSPQAWWGRSGGDSAGIVSMCSRYFSCGAGCGEGLAGAGS